MMWGQRNNVNAAAPSTPGGSTESPQELNLQPSTWTPHQQVHIYRSAEESLNARKTRLDTIGELAEPLALAAT
jgi:hypothetical protein